MEAFHQGNHLRAKDLLTRLIKLNSKNKDYWLWMSAVVDTDKERIFCLKEVLRLDPQNQDARIGLIMLGELPADESLVIPYDLQKRKWGVELESELKGQKLIQGKRSWFAVAAGAGMVLILAAMLIMGIFGLDKSPIAFLIRRNTPAVNIILPTYNNLESSSTDIPAAASETLPAPSENLPQVNYTPTPLYINTPHPKSEAYRTGLKAFNQQDWNTTIDYMSQVITIEPDSPDAYYYMAEAYRLKGDTDRALAIFNQIIKDYPLFAPGFLGRAKTRMTAAPSRWQEARNDLKTAVNLDRNLLEAYLELANLDLSLNNPQGALEWMTTARSLYPESYLVYAGETRANLELGEFDRALESARQANQADLSNPEGYRLLAEAFIKAGQAKYAADPLKIYLSTNPNDSEALAWMGSSYYAQGNLNDALQALNRSLAIDSRQLDAYIQRAQIEQDQEDYDSAEKDFEQALTINKKSFAANLGLGINYLKSEYSGNAYQQLSISEAYAKSNFEKAQVYFYRAQSLENLEEFKPAVRDWQALLALPKTDVPADWRAQAEKQLALLITSTPLPNTPTPTLTSQPTEGLKITASPTP